MAVFPPTPPTGDTVRYTYFEVRNFKGIGSLRLDLEPSPTGGVYTLVGLNESGKTTVLEAIDYFTPGREGLDPIELAGRIRPDEYDLIPAAQRGNFNDNITIPAGVCLDDRDVEDLRIHLRKAVGYKLTSLEKEFSVADTCSFAASKFGRRQGIWAGFDGMGRARGQRKDWPLSDDHDLWLRAVDFIRSRMPAIWYFPNFLFDFPARIYLEEQDSDSQRDRFYRALLQDILDALNQGDVSVSDHILARVASGKDNDRRSVEKLLLDMSREVSSAVFGAWNRIFKRELTGKRVILDVHLDEPDRWYVELKIEDTDGLYFLHERSLGFRWFFVFLLLTRYRGLRKNSTSMVYLFDEPASNLHPTAQAQLLKTLEQLADQSTVIYSTHSHHLINPDWLEATYVVRNKGLDPATVATDYSAHQTDIVLDRYRSFAAHHPDQSHYFQPILDMLDYAPSRLELVPDVIMTEGKNDFYSLRYMATVALPGEYDDLHIMPGGGAGSLDSVIRLYLSWARPFVVLLDSDTEGTAQQVRYLERFGPLLRDRVLLLSDVLSDWAGKSLESVFTEEDRLAIQRTSDPEAKRDQKGPFNRAVQELLAAKRSVPLSETTMKRFKTLLSGLASRLASG
jgi:energy-coupling factor transporter ATP-binding protein EcfA2